MEQKIKKKINDNLLNFKQNIQSFLKQTNSEIINKDGSNVTNAFLENMYDFPSLELSKEDFQKRIRTKNNIPNYSRCCALRLNGERCTRKKKAEGEFCGTHLKGIPNGSIQEKNMKDVVKIETWLEEICGIHQYIDINHNVYSTEDINSNVNPRVVNKWDKNEKGEYFIVS
jgi:hypothetical protein